MTLNRREILAAAALAACGAARADSGITHLIIPYPAGGPLDLIGRALAEGAKDEIGTIVIDNRPGAGGDIGADLAARAAPDGHTLVMGAVATHAINPWLYAHVPYDPIRDFTPITLVAQVPNVLVMNAAKAEALKIDSVGDLIAYAKAHPGELNYGSGGNGSAGHLAGEMLKSEAGIHVVHIPYAGGAPAQAALLAGQVDFNIDNLATAASNIKAGKLKALAVTTRTRSSAMPALPTMIESGLPQFDISTWFGIFGPAHLSDETTARLNKAFVDALNAPGVKARMALMMAEPSPTTPQQFADFVKSELAKYQKVVKLSGAKIE